MPRRPSPDPATRIDCQACSKPTNGAGYFGAMCQCARPPVIEPALGHGANVGPGLPTVERYGYMGEDDR